MTLAQNFFDSALVADPDNVSALVVSAAAEATAGGLIYVSNSPAAFRSAEAKLTKALSLVPDYARAHTFLGFVYIYTKRARRGIAECEHALALDRNVAPAHAYIGMGKVFIGHPEETEFHIQEALRLSPRDTLAYVWMTQAGIAQNQLGSCEPAAEWFRRAIEANRNYPVTYFRLASALAQLGRFDEARSTVQAGLALNPTFTISRASINWSAPSDDPIYLAQLEPVIEGLRLAGVPES
jgi:tetratricopeptide (TPR) repeat protein